MTADYAVKDIIAELRANLTAHVEDYEVAVDLYKHALAEKLSSALDKLKHDKDVSVFDNFGLQVPSNLSKLYNDMINIYSMVKTDYVELTMEEANRIFNDEWEWLLAAKLINTSYTSSFR